jgi:hypothetical protein
MDPNETYRQLSKYFSANEGPGGISYDEARELWHALDGWIFNGGFLPNAWPDEFSP